MYVEIGWIKFDPDGFWTGACERWRYPEWLRLLVGGGLKVIGGICLVIPWAASHGALGLAVVMLGAWGTRAHDGRWNDVGWISASLIGLAWIGYA